MRRELQPRVFDISRVIAIVNSTDQGALFAETVTGLGFRLLALTGSQPLPGDVRGLLIADSGSQGWEVGAAQAVASVLRLDLPVLGNGTGMHFLNAALGGGMAVRVDGHAANEGSVPTKNPIFLSPGGKVAHAIGGSGWVNITCSHASGLRAMDVADGVLASAYSRDGMIEAIERPGRQWVMGVQWALAGDTGLPSGFENVLGGFLERCAGE